MKSNKRAWIYCRIDAPEDTHGALKGQRKQLMDYAEQMGFTVVGSSDDLASAKSLERPGLKRMMESAQAGMFDALLVRNVSRIGRDTYRTIEYLERLGQMGIQTYSPQEGILDFTLRKVVKDAMEPSNLKWQL